MTKPFDPVVVRETRLRMIQKADALGLGTKAADALLWFDAYAVSREARDVIRFDIRPLANATLNAELADAYINDAAMAFLPDILKDAIARAREDFEAARKLATDQHPTSTGEGDGR